MIALLWFVLAILASPFKSKSRLEAENAALRRQLIVLRRNVHGRIRLINNDRLFFVQLYRWFPSIRFVPFNGSGTSRHKRSSVGFITATFGFRFSVHSGVGSMSVSKVGYGQLTKIGVPGR